MRLPTVRCFAAGVLTAAVLIGTLVEAEAQLKAPDQARYIAVAARQAENDAVSLANELRERGLAVKVYSLANGWFAIAIDHQPVAPAKALLASLQQRGVLPADAYLTTGERYQMVIWTSEGGGRRLAQAPGASGVPELRLSRQAPAVAAAQPRQSTMIEPGRYAGNQAVLDRLTTLSRLPEDAIVMAYFRDSHGVSFDLESRLKFDWTQAQLCLHPDLDRGAVIDLLASKGVTASSVYSHSPPGLFVGQGCTLAIPKRTIERMAREFPAGGRDDFDPRHFLAKGPGIVSFDWLSMTALASAKAAQSSYAASVSGDGFAAVFVSTSAASDGTVCLTSEMDRTLVEVHLRNQAASERFDPGAAGFDTSYVRTTALRQRLSVSVRSDLETVFSQLKSADPQNCGVYFGSAANAKKINDALTAQGYKPYMPLKWPFAMSAAQYAEAHRAVSQAANVQQTFVGNARREWGDALVIRTPTCEFEELVRKVCLANSYQATLAKVATDASSRIQSHRSDLTELAGGCRGREWNAANALGSKGGEMVSAVASRTLMRLQDWAREDRLVALCADFSATLLK